MSGEKIRIETPNQWTRTLADLSSESRMIFTEKDGENYGSITIPYQFQGRSLILDAFKNGKERKPTPPFRVAYVLINPFWVFDDTASFEMKVAGHTGLTIADSFNGKSMEYSYSKVGTAGHKKAKLTWEVKDGEVKRLMIELDEPEPTLALRCADIVVASVLDYICFVKEIPLSIHHIEICEAKTNELVQMYAIFPYRRKVELNEVLLSGRIPTILIPLLRLFREAVNSTNPYYRLLCLFRIGEGLKKTIRFQNNQKVKDLDSTRKRPKQKIPENEYTKTYFSNWIGKPMESYLDHVEHNFRKYIAHLIIDESLNWAPDPGTAQHAYDTDKVNSMLISIIRQLIVDEWTFMKENGIDGLSTKI
nr:methylamine utilization protein MauJ [Nitrosomonas nitrosa]